MFQYFIIFETFSLFLKLQKRRLFETCLLKEAFSAINSMEAVEKEEEDVTEYWIDTKLITIGLIVGVAIEVLIDLIIIATSGHKVFF
ncbi:hypothetical protein [Sulfurisphaera ohwakuensis]|uniref:hypothetical protein n=1 Tax=Sulfurisphaera ohwakuensis TaxID=69656 RepID=UPI0036F38595